ncbi:MAG: VWA domain-containing protein [Candidatus Aminicenantales bacterium]
MERKNFFLRSIIANSDAIYLVAFIIFLIVGVQSFSAEEILFSSNFSDLKTKWNVWDDPQAEYKPSQWRVGLTELSGIKNEEEKVATILLAGEKSWQNYTVETSLFTVGATGYLTGIICGYQDQDHFYVAGYNFSESRFELEAKTPDGYEMLGYCQMDFPPNVEIPLRLDFTGNRLRFSANKKVIFDIEDRHYASGKFGLGASGFNGAEVLFGQVTVKSLKLEALPPRNPQDLLSKRYGAKVISATLPDEFECLMDHKLSLTKEEKDNGYELEIDLQEEKLPLEAVFAFPQEKAAEIHKIGFQLADSSFPEKIEFLVSEQNSAHAFHSLGIFDIKPESGSYQEFKITPVKARYLKIHLLSSASQDELRLEEIFVYGFPQVLEITAVSKQGSKTSSQENILFKEDFSSANLSKWQIWDDPQASSKKSQWKIILSEFSGVYNEMKNPATVIFRGEKSWKNYSLRTNLYAVQAEGNLTGFIFCYQDHDHYYLAGYNFSKDRFELGVQTPNGFEILAFAEVDFPRGEWIPLEINFAQNRIIFKFKSLLIFDINDDHYLQGRVGLGTSGLGRGFVLIDKIKAVSIEPRSLPTPQELDLLSSRMGAAVIYRKAPPKTDQFSELIDHDLRKKEDMGNTYELDLTQGKLPEEAVFCFPQGRFVEIHKIGFRVDDKYFPKEIKFWISNQTPKSGFRPLTSITLQAKPNSYQEFSVKPTRTKYLKIQITKAYDEEEIYIDEMFIKGFFKEIGIKQGGEENLGQVQLQEKETNDSFLQAQLLPPNIYLGGKAGQKDVDFYKVQLKGQANQKFVLYLNNIGILRPGYTLYTKDQNEVKPSDTIPEGNILKIVFTSLKPGDYYLKIVRPETFLTIVYDDSGSMGESVPIVQRILKGYLDNLGQGLNLKLMKYTDEAVSLSAFTHDQAQLKRAIETEVEGGGGTDTFLGLMEAIKSLKEKQGNRAVLAIFDEIDGESDEYLQQYVDLWNSILDGGISFSIIGVQSGWDEKTEYFGNTRRQIFSEIAYASGGQFYHSPSDQQVEKSANTIFKQLTSPVKYRIRAEWEEVAKKPGSIQILFAQGAAKKVTKNVELILDASNSMWGQVKGESKIAIARRVLTQIINGLPEMMNVGLRVYGHRYPLKDKRACQDTELVVPIRPVVRNQLIETVNNIQPKGKTPLVFSVLQAGKDFENIEKGSIVLITDGIESCNGEINSVAPALKKLGIGLKVHIVGFDIKEAKSRQQLEAIAQSTGGVYLDARDSQQLLSSLQQTLQIEYELLDDKGIVQTKGFVGGEPAEIMEGVYKLRLLLELQPLEIDIIIKPGQKSTFVLSKEKEKWTIKKGNG